MLSARGLDLLDADMQHARHELAADPTEETIERFTALEEKFRERGGYEAESEVAQIGRWSGSRRGPSYSRTWIHSREVNDAAST